MQPDPACRRDQHQHTVLISRRPLRAHAVMAAGILALLVVLGGCQQRHDIEVINPCDDRVVVHLSENPDPRTSRGGDNPERVVVAPPHVPLRRTLFPMSMTTAGARKSSKDRVSGRCFVSRRAIAPSFCPAASASCLLKRLQSASYRSETDPRLRAAASRGVPSIRNNSTSAATTSTTHSFEGTT